MIPPELRDRIEASFLLAGDVKREVDAKIKDMAGDDINPVRDAHFNLREKLAIAIYELGDALDIADTIIRKPSRP